MLDMMATPSTDIEKFQYTKDKPYIDKIYVIKIYEGSKVYTRHAQRSNYV